MVVLDSSAWLAHLFNEPGAEQVNSLFEANPDDVAISALSIAEVYGRLKALGAAEHWPETWATYTLLFSRVLAVDEAIAHKAIELRAAASKRVPVIDALIAATAVHHNGILVHRDPHFNAIPNQLLQQNQLPEK
jgi:predicted nucleic acid-binding protein